jgi:MFS family permease
MVLLAVLGAGLAVSGPAMTGLIPEVVSAGRLQPANALVGLAQSLGSIGGPAVAGVVVAVASPGWAILADALTYLVSAWCLGTAEGAGCHQALGCVVSGRPGAGMG